MGRDLGSLVDFDPFGVKSLFAFEFQCLVICF